MVRRDPGSNDRRALLYGWWYVTIGLGFLLLGLRSLLFGGRPWLTVLRWVIAAGFLLLGAITLKSRRGR